MATIEPGQVWRDLYGDGKPKARGSAELYRNHRTVRIIGQEDDGRWIIEMVTDVAGRPPRGNPRRTRVKEQTLMSGYELQTNAVHSRKS